ncbi:GNAT family N-acetyltransferase [Marinicellulosiphila megalodicopiae]|uniref:GNAT family N-acetyltransferase n=1 Tax=Marinicellulosiphila megalodicopiae TaxID=2724896 RepID=UPI003BB0CA41
MKTIEKISYRKATEKDIPQLIELRIKQLIDEGYPEIRDIRHELQTYFANSLSNGSLVCWLGLSNDIIIATGGLCFYQLPGSFSNPTGTNAYITNMYTDDQFRKQGIASLLIDKLLVEAKERGFVSVKLHASTHGKSVYEKAGFVKADGYMGLTF